MNNSKILRGERGRFVKGYHPPTEFKEGQHISPATEFKKGHKAINGEEHYYWKGGISQSYCRRKAAECLGRKLKKDERIHHIDMDRKNNECDNFLIYKRESDHMKSHRSLESLVPLLMEQKIIGFENGRYYKL